MFRRLGIARSGGKLLRFMTSSTMQYDSRYELKFAAELLGSVSSGDCVWDVGANIGHFTRKLAERVGHSGCVVAFEPFRSSYERLLAATEGLPQVRCIQLALGADERDVFVDGIPESPSNSLVAFRHGDRAIGERVHVTTGARLIRDGYPCPDVIKIDVEGFEEDVLWGFRESLGDTCCATILMEVHFNVSQERGFLRAPARAMSLLHDFGFKTNWLSPNHLKASRPRK
jgi:FkbM family methyltransferase